MDRIKDYSRFAAWFVGLGYVVLWPVTASELGGPSFGATMFCRDGAPEFLGFFCHSTHSMVMPPGLHLLGFTSTLFVTLHLLFCAARRSRRAPRAASPPEAPAVPPRRQPQPPLRKIKPRSEFGLRGVPR